MVRTLHFHCWGPRLEGSLVRELRSFKPHSLAKKKRGGGGEGWLSLLIIKPLVWFRLKPNQ